MKRSCSSWVARRRGGARARRRCAGRLYGHGRAQLVAEAGESRLGKPWVVTIRVLQHGRTPMRDAKPEIRIRNAAGKLFTFKGRATATVGSYRARVVFPKAWRYSLGVYDGFPVAECARVHTFKSVLIVAVENGLRVRVTRPGPEAPGRGRRHH